MFRNILIFIVILITTKSFAQNHQLSDNTNVWLSYVGTHKFADNWSAHLEVQWRRSDLLQDAMQLLPRVGINYHLSARSSVSLGYAFVETHPYGALPVKSRFPEHRTWQQLQFRNNLGRFELVNRLRLEQRWANLPVVQPNNTYAAGDAVYTNRFRYLQRFSIPFKGKEIGVNAFYMTMFDEFFINFGENVKMNIFDQNRLFLGIGYTLPKVGRLELGYMNQLLIKSDGVNIENNHTVNLTLSANFDVYTKQKK